MPSSTRAHPCSLRVAKCVAAGGAPGAPGSDLGSFAPVGVDLAYTFVYAWVPFGPLLGEGSRC